MIPLSFSFSFSLFFPRQIYCGKFLLKCDLVWRKNTRQTVKNVSLRVQLQCPLTGGHSTKFYTGRLRPEVKPLIILTEEACSSFTDLVQNESHLNARRVCLYFLVLSQTEKTDFTTHLYTHWGNPYPFINLNLEKGTPLWSLPSRIDHYRDLYPWRVDCSLLIMYILCTCF